MMFIFSFFFFFQAEDGIRDYKVTGVQTCALPIWGGSFNGSHCKLENHAWPDGHGAGAVDVRTGPGQYAGAGPGACGHRAVPDAAVREPGAGALEHAGDGDRKSTRLNSSHLVISYA